MAGAVLSVHVPRDLARFAFRVLLAHAANPDGLTDFELASLVRGQQNSAGKRRGELMAQGYILRTEGRRPAPSGSTAIVWKITETGLALAELMIERNDPGMPPLPSRAAP